MGRDKIKGIFIVAFFGMAGIAVLITAWTQPMPVSERILSTFAGSIGLLIALIRTLILRTRTLRTRTSVTTILVEAKAQDKP